MKIIAISHNSISVLGLRSVAISEHTSLQKIMIFQVECSSILYEHKFDNILIIMIEWGNIVILFLPLEGTWILRS